MKSDTLNGILTFVLGVLVVLGVIFAVRLILITHDARLLQRQAMLDNLRLTQAQGMLNDALAYNQKYQSPELSRILQSIQPRAANH
jgi:hypothetical protein